MISEGVDLIILPYLLDTHSERQTWVNSVDPYQTPQNAASDQGLHSLPLVQQFYAIIGSKMVLLKKYKVKSKECKYLG